MKWRVATTLSVILSLALLIAWPWIVGASPGEGSSRRELVAYGTRALLYFGLTCLSLLIAAFSAAMLMRQNRMEYLGAVKDNVRELVDGSLSDHATKREGSERDG